MQKCHLTGNNVCQCAIPLQPHSHVKPLNTAHFAIRNLWIHHVIYTKLYIDSVLHETDPANSSAILKRLLDNQHEIGAEANKYVNLGDSLTDALVQHIKLAGKMAAEPITKNVDAFILQGDDIARILSAINPRILPLRDAQTEMRTHTHHVVELYIILKEGRYSDEIVELDAYYNHVLSLADAMYALLSNPSRYSY